MAETEELCSYLRPLGRVEAVLAWAVMEMVYSSKVSMTETSRRVSEGQVGEAAAAQQESANPDKLAEVAVP